MVVKSPITLYVGGIVIDQTGHTKELYNYYWTAYSRGTDGRINTNNWTNEPEWNNTYLDGYSTLRTKSIYDPCPYSYRISTNGTYNQFSTTYPTWTKNSYIGGAKWTFSDNSTWLPVTGSRWASTGLFIYVGHQIGYYTATAYNATAGYLLEFNYNNGVYANAAWGRSEGGTIRCMEECD